MSGDNVKISVGNSFTNARGQVQGNKDVNISAGKDINLTSVETVTRKEIGSSRNYTVNEKVQNIESTISGGISVSEGESKSEINKNSNFYAENNIDISGKDMTVKGGNIEGEHIKIDVDNLHVESLQDKSSSSDKSINVHGSSDNKNNTSTGAGMTSGKYDKEWVENQTSIIGREDSHITVEGNTHLEGGLLGGKDTTLDTGSLTFNDIKDYEKGTNIGLSENISKGQKDENSNDYTSQLDYSATDREQITHATVGAGTITVGEKEENPEELNRDESKAQEITKDVTVDNINMKYDSERRDWTLKELDSIMSNDIKTVVVDPLEKLNEAFNFVTLKELTPYKVTIEKDENGKIVEKVERIDKSFEDNSIVHVNGMQTDFNEAIEEIKKQHIQKNLEDSNLTNLRHGEKQEFILMHNDTNGFLADLYESASAIDRYGTKGPNKVYSDAAKKLGDILWENKDKVNEVTAFSQGTLLYAAAMKYIEDTHGEGSVAQIKTNTIILVGSAQPVEDFKEYMTDRGNNAEINSKVDGKDLVGSLVGLNPGNVETDEVIKAKEDKTFLDYHSGYTEGQKTAKEEKTSFQKGRKILDKGLQIFNYKNYFRKDKEKNENKK